MHRRLRAEWENPEKILLALPGEDTDWNYILPRALEQYRTLIDALVEGGERVMLVCRDECESRRLRQRWGAAVVIIEDIPYNDTWTRDYGPLTVEEDGRLLELDFGFNGWGLKFASDRDNLVNLNLAGHGYRESSRYVNCRDFELEGGSIETDGRGTILTTSRCLTSPNRNGGKSKTEVETILKERLGAERILWLDHGFLAGDDTDSHIDTLARMAPGDTIVYVGAPEDAEDIHHDELLQMENQLKDFRTAEGKPYRLIRLPFPDPVFDDEGTRLPATYANYLVTGRNVFVPVYGSEVKDSEALEKIGLAFPDHKIFPVDCAVLLWQHGSLHCSTMQLY